LTATLRQYSAPKLLSEKLQYCHGGVRPGSILLEPDLAQGNSAALQFWDKELLQHGFVADPSDCNCIAPLLEKVRSNDTAVRYSAPHRNVGSVGVMLHTLCWPLCGPNATVFLGHTTVQEKVRLIGHEEPTIKSGPAELGCQPLTKA